MAEPELPPPAAPPRTSEALAAVTPAEPEPEPPLASEPPPEKPQAPVSAAPAPAVQKPPPAAAPAPSLLGSLELQVSDALSRQPIAAGRVFVALASEAANADARTWRNLSSFKSASIDNGRVEIAGLATGEYTYVVTGGGGTQPKTGRVFVGQGKTMQLVAVERRPGWQPGSTERSQGRGRRGAGSGQANPNGAPNPGAVPGRPGSSGDRRGGNAGGNNRGANPGGNSGGGDERTQQRRRRDG